MRIDRPFFRYLGDPSRSPSRDLDSGDVIWLVPELTGGGIVRGLWEVLILQESTAKLLSAAPIPRGDFEDMLSGKLQPLAG